MAKVTNYYCKDCLENNNGWCPRLKMNGLKEITKEMCEAAGGSKISKFGGAERNIPIPKDPDDILAKAHQEMAATSVKEAIQDNEEKKKMIKLLKNSLSLESDYRVIDGTRITTVTLLFDGEPICDTDFYSN